MIDLILLENGNLRLKFVGEDEDKEDLQTWVEEEGINGALRNALESYWTNGWHFCLAGDLGHLSESPILLEDYDYDENDNLICNGKSWYSPNYQVLSEIDQLLTVGYVDFLLLE